MPHKGDGEYKINKYEYRLRNADSNESYETYIKKLKRYHLNDLLRPTQVKENNYVTKIDPTQPILVYGYGAIHEKSKTVPVVFERRSLNPDDVMFDIKYVGVCHSDWHTLLNEWETTKYPVVAGHEMTGIVIDVGSEVKDFKKDDKVALSPLYNSCMNCQYCNKGEEQYCENGTTETYNQYDRLPGETGQPTGPITYGGYCNIMVVKQNFLYKFPNNLPMDKGAPLLCAGLTVFNALKSLNIQENSPITVGVAGIGGLGHLLLKICKAINVKTIALTTTKEKINDAKRFGASDVILMNDLEKLNLLEGSIDYIVDTIPFKHDLDPYLKLLKISGTLCVVGAFYSLNPDFNEIIRKGKKIQGSNIAGTSVTKEYLEFTKNTNSSIDVLPEIQIITFNELNKTRDALVKSQCRYRFVIDVKKSMEI